MHRKVFSIVGLSLLLVLVSVWGNTGQASQVDTPHVPQIDFGKPGLSFRYVEELGVAETPYLGDSDHIFRPYGIGLDNSGNLWVAEESGKRALSYAGDGTFLMSLGQAGFQRRRSRRHFRYAR